MNPNLSSQGSSPPVGAYFKYDGIPPAPVKIAAGRLNTKGYKDHLREVVELNNSL